MLVSSTYSDWASSAHSGSIQNLVTAPNGGQEAADLVFATSTANCTAGIYMNFETETYNSSTGAIVDWVNVPSMSAGSVIYACYDATAVTTDQSHPSSTWNNNYVLVAHLPTPTSTLTAFDSTSNANNGTITAATTTVGAIDGGASFNGSSAYVNFNETSKLPIFSTTTPYTVEFWTKYPLQTSGGRLFAEGSSASNNPLFTIDTNNSGTNLVEVNLRNTAGTFALNGQVATTPISSTTWNQIVWTDYQGTAAMYINGVKDASNFNYTSSTMSASQFNADCIGALCRSSVGSYLTGSVDEVELMNATTSSQWVLTQYNNQSAPDDSQGGTFYHVGAQTSFGGGSTPVSMAFTWLDEDD